MASVCVSAARLMCVWLGWVCVFGAAAAAEAVRKGLMSEFTDDGFTDGSTDMATQHMYKLYDKYHREMHRDKDGNTVRSFKLRPETVEQRVLYRLNLTSLQDSEEILTTTLHFFFDKRPRQRSWFCKHFKKPTCRIQNLQHLPSFRLVFRNSDPSLASSLGDVTFHPHRRGVWHTKDVSEIIKEARQRNQRVITLEFDYGEKYQRYREQLSSFSLPYVLVYANDLAITEPNSVAVSLQRYDPSPVDEPATRSPNSSPNAGVRIRRDLRFPDPIQNNELPDVEYDGFKQHDMWESSYLGLKPKSSKKERKKKSREHAGEVNKSQVLSFDEKTMRKARRRQWKEPPGCSRRYLKVDFADIGWSEWILSPKSFDAYYCAGTCEFPLPKVVRPSNHATIQSIVKTVGIIPGIPEPCCVPEKMKPLSVLFLDESRNIVLKIYPNMSVETCSCR